MRVAKGPANTQVRSSTRTPFRGSADFSVDGGPSTEIGGCWDHRSRIDVNSVSLLAGADGFRDGVSENRTSRPG